MHVAVGEPGSHGSPTFDVEVLSELGCADLVRQVCDGTYPVTKNTEASLIDGTIV